MLVIVVLWFMLFVLSFLLFCGSVLLLIRLSQVEVGVRVFLRVGCFRLMLVLIMVMICDLFVLGVLVCVVGKLICCYVVVFFGKGWYCLFCQRLFFQIQMGWVFKFCMGLVDCIFIDQIQMGWVFRFLIWLWLVLIEMWWFMLRFCVINFD